MDGLSPYELPIERLPFKVFVKMLVSIVDVTEPSSANLVFIFQLLLS